MPETPPGEIYRGPPGIARESTWLTGEDLPHDKDVTLTIENVRIRRNLEMQGGRPKKVALSLQFTGKERELMLNATNRKVLMALYGASTGDWFGKRVIVHVEQDVRRPDGTRGPAVRIRAREPKAEAARTAATVPPQTTPDQTARDLAGIDSQA
jgi:hypothetical protein